MRRESQSTRITIPTTPMATEFLPTETLIVGHDRCREAMLRAGLEATKVITMPDYGALVLRPPDLTFADRMTLHVQTFLWSCGTSAWRTRATTS